MTFQHGPHRRHCSSVVWHIPLLQSQKLAFLWCYLQSLRSNNCCIAACFVVNTYLKVYMPQYTYINIKLSFTQKWSHQMIAMNLSILACLCYYWFYILNSWTNAATYTYMYTQCGFLDTFNKHHAAVLIILSLIYCKPHPTYTLRTICRIHYMQTLTASVSNITQNRCRRNWSPIVSYLWFMKW